MIFPRARDLDTPPTDGYTLYLDPKGPEIVVWPTEGSVPYQAARGRWVRLFGYPPSTQGLSVLRHLHKYELLLVARAQQYQGTHWCWRAGDYLGTWSGSGDAGAPFPQFDGISPQ